jgi:hypothetical protein
VFSSITLWLGFTPIRPTSVMVMAKNEDGGLGDGWVYFLVVAYGENEIVL